MYDKESNIYHMPTFITTRHLSDIELALDEGCRKFNYGACDGIGAEAYYELVMIFLDYVVAGEKIREVNVNRKLKKIMSGFQYDNGVEYD